MKKISIILFILFHQLVFGEDLNLHLYCTSEDKSLNLPIWIYNTSDDKFTGLIGTHKDINTLVGTQYITINAVTYDNGNYMGTWFLEIDRYSGWFKSQLRLIGAEQNYFYGSCKEYNPYEQKF